MFVTFLCLAGTAGAELNLISPLAGLEDRLETVEPASDDLLTRLRYGFELPRGGSARGSTGRGTDQGSRGSSPAMAR